MINRSQRGQWRAPAIYDPTARPPSAKLGVGRHRGQAKTTPEQVLEVMHLRNRYGLSVAKIARRTGLTFSTVRGIVESGNGTNTCMAGVG